ncbi:hypothetical protein EYF80_030920 [Liparis tanakae]|uniref:Uncharacterized protein n=1 Tax=Liparis tanakae TaxID=230148 RepID=A0A4Z2GYX4_9TELE|nr:hypothetical protein EYF80_030920 [Liparis tanakae]
MDPAWRVAELFSPLYPSICHPGFPPVYQPKPLQPFYQPSSHQPWQPPAIPAAVAWSEEKDPLLQGMREALAHSPGRYVSVKVGSSPRSSSPRCSVAGSSPWCFVAGSC